MTQQQPYSDVLPPGAIVGDYVIRSIIGAGGFGVTYRAEHVRLAKEFAIKEYFPRGFAWRHRQIASALTQSEKTYRWGLDRFLQEARALARFHHRAIVGVSNIFEANNTAYMVLTYERGRDMRAWRASLGRAPTQAEFDAILRDLLDALGELHATGLMHRDIAPDNILIRTDGTPVLLDFGAARQALGEQSSDVSAIIKVGYSPMEQYTTQGRAQGAWSDIYALGATLYCMIVGSPPPESTQRMIEECYEPLAKRGLTDYRPEFLAAIDRALHLRANDRPRTITEWRAALEAASLSLPPAMKPQPAEVRTFSDIAPPVSRAKSVTPARSRRSLQLIALTILLGVGGMAAFALRRSTTGSGSQIFAGTCDGLAAIPFDKTSRVPGLEPEQVDARRAVSICRQELASAAPADQARIKAQLGRALRISGDAASAEPLLAEASAARHTEARVLYGDLIETGSRPNEVEACRLYKQAADIGSPRGKASFASCLRRGTSATTRDDRAATALYREAAEAGARDGMALYSVALRDGLGVTKDAAEAVTWAERAAKLGDARALFILADLYELGSGVKADHNKSIELYSSAKPQLEKMFAAHINDAGNVLGLMYRDGLGIRKDEVKAAELFQTSAERGSSTGMMRLADLYVRGAGVTQDTDKALKLLRDAIERSDDDAANYLGALYEQGRGTTRDYNEAMKWYRFAADRGNADAMNNVAGLLDSGKVGKANPTEAARWYRRAADRDYAPAMNELGRAYATGRGVKQDLGEARNWYLKAANLGNVTAMINIADNYQVGKGGKADVQEAIKWLTLAAAKGSDDAMDRLGDIYRSSKYDVQDFAKAVAWYRRAIEKGNALSMNALGVMYDLGEGLPKNAVEAARYYMLSAEKGNAAAMYNLAVSYKNGDGIAKSCNDADIWYRKAALAGDDDAKKVVAENMVGGCNTAEPNG